MYHLLSKCLLLGQGQGGILGIELKVSYLLGKCAITLVTPAALLFVFHFLDRVSKTVWDLTTFLHLPPK
jgi:hypothetical protein